ncbi:BTB/POZ and MATH domain-containing protein 2 [Symbiodinium microadriaticum]|uniref:BTB/POZ and MATH domain-containing protein 2 n=1 Tax=Symbiodinium microadriaticum TaxID=2951 RepID=A0A1Q9C559_SYMMI|nr:BTB/POZ and MATH domain-containing protein 2 [Symbiodinium microadriaticum]CAE7336025.1 BPM2 [Symbiodinium sp. KB8]
MAAAMTAEELEAEIETTRRQVEAEETRRRELEAETAQAAKRQRLRMELDDMRQILACGQRGNAQEAERRRSFDEDRIDWWRCSGGGVPRHPKQPVMRARGGNSTDCAEDVARGEYVWRITGFSWLKCVLKQGGDTNLRSMPFELGHETFVFCYNPWAGELCEGHHGSLAVWLETEDSIALRRRIYIKSRSGEFVQWGETSDFVHFEEDEVAERAYGPDVHSPGHPPTSLGIFGLSHEELLQSEWVVDDTLTAKFELEVRPDQLPKCQRLSFAVEVPETTMSQDTQALLEEGTCSDVEIVVQGEVIHAHSQILSARSEVFRKQLTSGMQEEVSKVIRIEDCDAVTFRAFLQFLYTDSLPDVKKLVADSSTASGSAESGVTLSQTQALLQVSHKYQVLRLQRWCEWKLYQQITTSEVCNILRQAHLIQARQLEKACLEFMKTNMSQVLKLPAYAELIKKWPQIGLKVSLFSAGVPETEATPAMLAFTTPPDGE